MIDVIKLILLGAVLLPTSYAAISDLRSFTIPNWTALAIALPFAAYALIFLAWQMALAHLAIAIAVFIICFVFWMMKLLGGGDLKMLSAVSLWLGPVHALPFMAVLLIAAAIFVVVLLLLRHWSEVIETARVPAFVRRLSAEAKINRCPYGLPIAIAAFIVIPPAIIQ